MVVGFLFTVSFRARKLCCAACTDDGGVAEGVVVFAPFFSFADGPLLLTIVVVLLDVFILSSVQFKGLRQIFYNPSFCKCALSALDVPLSLTVIIILLRRQSKRSSCIISNFAMTSIVIDYHTSEVMEIQRRLKKVPGNVESLDSQYHKVHLLPRDDPSPWVDMSWKTVNPGSMQPPEVRVVSCMC